MLNVNMCVEPQKYAFDVLGYVWDRDASPGQLPHSIYFEIPPGPVTATCGYR